jgi:hypothetical protein
MHLYRLSIQQPGTNGELASSAASAWQQWLDFRLLEGYNILKRGGIQRVNDYHYCGLPLTITTTNYLIRDELSATFSGNIMKSTASATYFYFSSRMCTDRYWSPEHWDDLLNSSRFYDVFWSFVTDVHWWILKPRTLRRFVEFVAIRPTMLRHFSRFVAINK